MRKQRVPEHIRKHLTLKIAPAEWLRRGRHLRRAAAALWEPFEAEHQAWDHAFDVDPNISEPSPDDGALLLLLAFAVENFLKGLFLAQLSPGALKELRGIFPGAPHQLAMIAEKVHELGLSESEIGLLQVFEHTIHWAGRYPSPMIVDGLVPMDASGTFNKFSLEYPDDYVGEFGAFAFCDRLEARLAGFA